MNWVSKYFWDFSLNIFRKTQVYPTPLRSRVITDAGCAITFRDPIHIININHKPRCQIMQDFNEALQMSHKNGSLTLSEELSQFILIVFSWSSSQQSTFGFLKGITLISSSSWWRWRLFLLGGILKLIY